MIAANALVMYFILAQLIAYGFRAVERYVESRYIGEGGSSPGATDEPDDVTEAATT